MIAHIKKAYFIGIGGIGMSAIARYFNQKGIQVSGYDRTATALTDKLEQEGISIRFSENVDSLPKDVDIVIYTPAVPNTHSELRFFCENGYTVIKRSEALGRITQGQFSIAVAGSHGKTTVTSMIAHILHQSGYGCNAFVGGVMTNYNSNFVMGQPHDTVVVEADEFDRSFLKLFPDIAVITAVDSDHLDIYGTKAEVEKAFIIFANQLKNKGILFVKNGLPMIEAVPNQQITTYELDWATEKNQASKADNFITKIAVQAGRYVFDARVGGELYQNVCLNMGGWYNVENVLAAMSVAHHLGIDQQAISTAVASFKGIKRRFEYIINTPNLVMIDDYAHHPAEVEAFMRSVRDLYPNKHITAIFQPHLYTRTRDFAKAFAQSLNLADCAVVLNIYPARELPIEGVSSELIFRHINLADKQLCPKEDIAKLLSNRKIEVLLTIGAGDIDKQLQQIADALLVANSEQQSN